MDGTVPGGGAPRSGSSTSASDARATEIAKRFFERIRLYARHQLRDPASSEDVAQETLHRVLAALREGRVQSEDALPAFVFGTARHLCLQHLRRRGREARALARLGRHAVPAPRAEPLLQLAREQRARALRCALSMMRAEDREILHEACCDSRSHAEIAASHGISLEAARVRRHRALKRLLEITESLEGGNVASGKETPA